MQCNTIQYNTIKYNKTQYNTIQHNAIQHSQHLSRAVARPRDSSKWLCLDRFKIFANILHCDPQGLSSLQHKIDNSRHSFVLPHEQVFVPNE